jgi:nucleotide-binding universal stress UspA family protein
MKSKLIALVDFSGNTKDLLGLAYEWAYSLKSPLLLFHQFVVATPALADTESRTLLKETEKNKALDNLKHLAKDFIQKGVQVDFEVTDLDIISRLPEIAAEDSILLTGLKGTGLMKKIFIGSTVTRIIEQLNYITVAVPEGTICTVPEKFVVAVSPAKQLNEHYFFALINKFKHTLKRVEFITGLEQAAEEQSKSEAYLKGLVSRYEHHVSCTYKMFSGKMAFDAVKEEVKKQPDAILVVQKGSRAFIDRVTRKFVVNELVHEGRHPLIILPE